MDALTLLYMVLGLWSMLAAGMALAWSVEQRTGNSGWVDVTWTLTMGAAGTLAVLFSSPGNARALVVIAMVLTWALRLAGHIAERTAKISDDPRKPLTLSIGSSGREGNDWPPTKAHGRPTDKINNRRLL